MIEKESEKKESDYKCKDVGKCEQKMIYQQRRRKRTKRRDVQV